MNFTIADWRFEPETKSIFNLNDGHIKDLTDQQIDLLLVLCEKNGDLVPQSEIEEKVWSGNVTDNTFKTAITNLRKCFDHKDSQGRDIVLNVRGKGYRLKCVEADKEESLKPEVIYITQNELTFTYRTKILAATFVLMLVGIFGITVKEVISDDDGAPPIPDELTILSYEKGAELNAAFHNTINLVAYLSFEDNIVNHQVKVRDLKTNKVVGFPQYQYSSSPLWIADELFFQVYDNQRCSIVKAVYTGNMTFSRPEKVTECGAVQSVSPIQADRYQEWLYFSFKESNVTPYVVKRFNLRSGVTQQLTTDSSENYGAYSIALSPDNNRLAYMNMTANSEIAVRLLDLNTLTIEELYSGVGYALNLLWNNNYELLLPIGKILYNLNIDTKLKTVARTFDEPLYSISKNNEGEYVISYGFLYTSQIKKLESDQVSDIFESSNQIGQLIVHEDTLYFVGQMKGNNQVWRRTSEELVALTDHKGGHRISSLSLSNDGRHLIYLLDNQIVTLDVQSQETTKIDMGSNLIKDVTWACDSNDIIFTNKVNGSWRLNKLTQVQGDSHIENVMQDVYGVQTDCESGLVALSSNSNNIKITDFQDTEYEIKSDKYLSDLNWKFAEGAVYYTEKGKLYKVDNMSTQAEEVYSDSSKMNSFDITNDKIVFTERTIGNNKLVVFKGLNIN